MIPPPPPHDTDLEVIGQALARLRKQAGLTQAQAAELANMEQGTWTKYESGDRKRLRNSVVQTKLAEALGFNLDDFEAAIEATRRGLPLFIKPSQSSDTNLPATLVSHAAPAYGQAGFEVRESPRPDVIDFTRYIDTNTRVLRMYGEEVAPYVEPGSLILYHLVTPARRNQGVVIKKRGGEYLVRKYIRQNATHVECYRFEARNIDGLTAYVELPEQIANAAIEGVYPIMMRTD